MPASAARTPRVFRVELSDDERAALDRRARAAGLSPDDALRDLVRDGLRITEAPTADTPTAHDLGHAAAGSIDGPEDLATNAAHLDGYGT